MLGAMEAVVARLSQFLVESFAQGRGLDIVAKKVDDVTRRVDLEAEELAYKMFKETFREGGVLYSEEGGVYRWGNERYVFVLDPLDGSHNFAAGIPLFSVSLAGGVYREGTISDLTHGVVAVLPVGTIYAASPETGARKNGKPLKRVTGSKIVFAAISNGFPEKTCEILRKLGARGRSLGSSAAELTFTAEGIAKGFIDLRDKLRVLDVAGALVVGKYVDGFKYVIYGGESLNSRLSIIAGDPDFVNEAAQR